MRAGGAVGAAEPPSTRERFRRKWELVSRDGVSPAGGSAQPSPFDVTNSLGDVNFGSEPAPLAVK
jgi:hypothetical protein